MKIGLALGSGAARGWAHIGIIQALEELGIKVDVMSGCSIGAYVGAAYASGKLPDLAQWVSSLTEWQVLGLMGVGLHRGGLVSGVKVFQALEDNFSAATFEELSIPLAVAAVDLYSGREVCFQKGPIGSAVRASCAIPGLFPPVSHNNRWLVDGAVVNPVPVNLCRQLGADFVIAVNLSADFRPQVLEQNIREHEHNEQKTDDFFRKSKSRLQQWFKSDDSEDIGELTLQTKKANQTKIPSIVGVMSSSLEILQARVTRSRLAGDPPDIILEPQLRDFGIMEFYRAEELIEEGRNCVRRIAEQIKYQLRLD
jgi:NTE family protein